ncbi:MAG: hypothetical protein HC803_06600 [Saprospiraceae bacterium]|nr:hypothetical protein [Saprospiraceae bacterium]
MKNVSLTFNIKKWLVLIVFLKLSIGLFAQNLQYQEDSLLILIKKAKVDTTKIHLYENLADILEYQNTDKFREYTYKALNISLKHKVKESIRNGYHNYLTVIFTKVLMQTVCINI